MALTGITLYCKDGNLNWACLPEFSQRLKKYDMVCNNFSAQLDRYPFSVNFSTVEDVIKYVQQNGTPNSFEMNFEPSTGINPSIRIALFKTAFHEKLISIRTRGLGNEEALHDFAAFLGLEPDYFEENPTPARTAFIAHRFEQKGTDLADRLARFLTLLGFSVKTGRAFAAKSIADKVKERLKSQHLIFVILTPGTDDTWLIQESALQQEDKPLFLLRDQDAEFKPGLLADHEFIPFQEGHFESVYQPILEGLRELGYLKFQE